MAGMTTLEKIQNEIRVLPQTEMMQLKTWFEELEADLWDAQIESDVLSGKLDQLAQQAKAHRAAGRTRPL